jgi:uncharacterized protein
MERAGTASTRGTGVSVPRRTAWITAAALLVAAVARADSPIARRLNSTALGEVREYTVRLPVSYAREPRRRFPVIYVLDGPPLDRQTAEVAARLAVGGGAPELIVVGIPNMGRDGRARDFLPPSLRFTRRDGSPFIGGADRFLSFLREELMPRVQREFRTAGPRILSGHSLGAIFVCYSLTAAPDLFEARLAHSPAIWRDEDAVVEAMARWLARPSGPAGFLSVTVGADEGAGMQSGYHKLRAALAAGAASAGLRWHAAITPGAVHETNVALATPDSLRAFFAGSEK